MTAAVPPELADRVAFAARIQVQLQARYPSLGVEPDPGRFALHVTGSGIDSHISLTPLWTACVREPGRTSALIADFVRQAESGLTPIAPAPMSLARILWCVRTKGYLRDHTRSDDLLQRPVAGSLVAFVAESLPNSIMQGVPREQWASPGAGAVAAAADANTAERFAKYAERIRSAERVARDGWSFKGDVLYMGSVLVVPDVLRALAERAGGDVLIAHPDRELVLAVPVEAEGAKDFRERVTRTWRAAMNPVSREVLRTDGESLAAVTVEPERRAGLLRRLLA
jgi:hypothetical protein